MHAHFGLAVPPMGLLLLGGGFVGLACGGQTTPGTGASSGGAAGVSATDGGVDAAGGTSGNGGGAAGTAMTPLGTCKDLGSSPDTGCSQARPHSWVCNGDPPPSGNCQLVDSYLDGEAGFCCPEGP